MPKILHLHTEIEVFEDENELSPNEKNVLEKARKVCQNAYAPYSNFWVGAAILLKNGKIVEGVNQENAAYPSGLCAERVALFACGVLYPQEEIEILAVVACPAHSAKFVPTAPCGACRQVMIEFENKQNQAIQILFQGEENKIYKFKSIADLLPIQFNSKSLNPKNG